MHRATRHTLPIEPAWSQQVCGVVLERYGPHCKYTPNKTHSQLQLVLDRPERMRALAATGAALADPQRYDRKYMYSHTDVLSHTKCTALGKNSMNSLQQTATPPALPGVLNPPPLAASASWLGRAAGSVALLRGEEEKENSTSTPMSADKLAVKVQAQLVMSDVSPPPASGMLKLADSSKVICVCRDMCGIPPFCGTTHHHLHQQEATPKKRSLIPALRLGGGGHSDNKGVQPLSGDSGVAAGKKALPNVAAKQLSIKGGSSSGGKQLMSL